MRRRPSPGWLLAGFLAVDRENNDASGVNTVCRRAPQKQRMVAGDIEGDAPIYALGRCHARSAAGFIDERDLCEICDYIQRSSW
jgi:hypothetical protein